ncbi:MAG TPA: glycine betaine ABC transporter substrate-binding protein [Solirubrobacteraceae bacterium]|jgi:osmoprotectant transport system substrate-binding protein|nr:glycine betaine ABC transporter substrate-binding protein [Solirubrobacteraceae bacterium]
MHRSHVYRALGAAVLTVALAACGSSSSSSSKSAPATTTAAAPAATTTTASTGPLPGVGKPPVTIGDKNFTEEYILGDLYTQALLAQGYKVTLKANIGTTEITYKALQSGQIDMYPEYDGTLLSAVGGYEKVPSSAAQTYTLTQAFVKKHGFELLNPTPFYDTDALAVTKQFATAHHLVTISDLKKLGHSLTLGAAPEFATRFNGLIGLKKLYGINPTFKPLAIGITYKAIDDGEVDTFDAFSTDAQLTTGKYILLTDPKHVFGYQYVTPVVKQSVVAAEGPAFTSTINKVSALLTLPAIQKMNAAVALDQQSPATVAAEFLKANGLVK